MRSSLPDLSIPEFLRVSVSKTGPRCRQKSPGDNAARRGQVMFQAEVSGSRGRTRRFSSVVELSKKVKHHDGDLTLSTADCCSS
jgi:hypothetical protein